MPLDLQSVALGMVVGSFGILMLGGSSLTRGLCDPQPIDKSEKNKINDAAKVARLHGDIM
jgi:hypothetical protein